LNIYTEAMANDRMHWTEKAVLKKDSAHLSLPVIQVLCLNNLYQEFKESREDSVRISSVHLDNSSRLFYNMNYQVLIQNIQY